MHFFFRFVKLALAGFIVLTTLALPAEACQVCRQSFLSHNSWCRPVEQEETGATQCTNFPSNTGGSYCSEGGTFCTWVNSGGGGTGGGGVGGGGGNGCAPTGFCPAECFSCGGGGSY